MNKRFILTAIGSLFVVALLVFTLDKRNVSTPASQSLTCLECHRSPNIHTNEGVVASQTFCFDCHADTSKSTRTAGDRTVSLKVTPALFQENPHRFIACIQCHSDVAKSPHRTDTGAQCLDCHAVHGEATAHSPHLRVDCQACHHRSASVLLDFETHRVKLAHRDASNQPIALTDHRMNDVSQPTACLKCHVAGNAVGAPAAVLPAKSVLCILCHPSPVAVGHTIFWIALAVLVFGTIVMVGFWFSGRVQGEETSLHRKISLASESVWQTIFSRKLFGLLKVFILDIILQRRILKDNIQRWSMHSLIFLAIFMRFALSLFTGLLFRLAPDSGLALTLLDKNSAFAALTYDLLGLLIVLGILWAAIQRFYLKPQHVLTEIEDNITLGIVGALVIIGFLASGARILLTQIPPELAAFSFVGYPIARVFSLLPVDWASVYPYLWYAHAVAAALFVACLPFGKLKHIFNVPLTYFMEAVDGVDRNRKF